MASALRTSLVKEASKVGDKSQTVDALLSLGFLNAENLAKFVAYRGVFDKCADYMSELVLASRLGLREVDEAAAVIAMHRLLEVSEGLQKIEGAIVRPGTKAA